MPSFFLCELQLITALLLICNSYISRSRMFVIWKLCVGFSIFDSVLFLLNFLFLFNKMHGVLDFKRHNSFQNKILEKPHTVLLLELWFLSCNKKFFKFNDICMNWNSLKTDLMTNFLNLENWRYENVSFSQK